MEYIIIWRHESRVPHLHVDSHGFVEKFSSREDAETAAKADEDGEDFADYGIYEIDYQVN